MYIDAAACWLAIIVELVIRIYQCSCPSSSSGRSSIAIGKILVRLVLVEDQWIPKRGGDT
jgi:hypothetical protein